MSETDARRLAFDILVDVEQHGAFADAALGRALDRATRMPDDDRRLATQLVYGVLAWRLRLDHTITAYARRASMDPRVHVALRLGIFQLAYLDRIPAYAVGHTTVGIVRAFAPHAAGFTNALIRRVTREGLAPLPENEPERTAVRLSHPAWLVTMWEHELGKAQAEALMETNNRSMPTVLRALTNRDEAVARLRTLGLDAVPAAHAPDAIRCSLPRTVPGLALPQGEASQLVTLMVGARAGERILDACAAPGGKTAYLAALVGREGHVTAVDAAANSARRIRATCEAAGVRNVEILTSPMEALRASASGEARVPGKADEFDAVLVDAPCSGLGTLREHPEIRWRRSNDDILDLAARQSTILDHASRMVREGGRLVYATCTLSHAENEAVVDDFLAHHDDFHEDSSPPHPALTPFLDDRGRMHAWPHLHDTGGFFAARLVKIKRN